MAYLRDNRPNFATSSMVANVVKNMMAANVGGVQSTHDIPCWLPDGKSASGWLSMANGIVDVSALARRIGGEEVDEAEIVRPHTHNFLSTFSLDYAYDAGAVCPMWDEYMFGVQPSPEMRDMLQMLMGLCLVPDCSYEVFFVLFGEGGCGKSVFMKTLANIVGKANICTLPLSKFGEKHSAHLLTESLVNIVGDLPTSDGSVSLHAIEGTLKDSVSGGLIACEKKNKEPYQAVATARHIFAANTLPSFADRTSGVWDRIRIVPFDVKFRGTERQIVGLERNLEKELPGIFIWAVRGLANLRSLRAFPRGARGIEEEVRHRHSCDHEGQFLRDNYELRNGGFVEGAMIYQEYRNFCSDNGFRPKNSANFATDLRRVFRGAIEDRKMVAGVRKRGFLNIEKLVEFVGTQEEF